MPPKQDTGGGASLHAYVINLRRSEARRAHVTRELAKTQLDWELVDAVDARQERLDPSELVSAEARQKGGFRPGAIACALSHRSVYERVLATSQDVALILEDDVILPADLAALSAEVASHMSGSEVVLLNYHQPGGVKLSAPGSRGIGQAGRQLIAEPVSLVELTSGAAYLATRAACERLATAFSPMRAFSDDWAWYVTNDVLDRVRCVAPMPVKQSAAFPTTIDYYRIGSLRWRLREVALGLRLLNHGVFQTLAERKRLRNFARWGALGEVEVVSGQRFQSKKP